MSSIISQIKSANASGHGNAILIAGVAGLFFSDVLPTPADAIYFKYERKLRNQWKAGEITPQHYWRNTALAYYGLNPLWWLLVGGVALSIKGDAIDKLKVLGGLIGAGAVFAVIHKNIQKDIKELENQNQVK